LCHARDAQAQTPPRIRASEGGLGNSPFEAGRVGFGVGFMVKNILCVFYIKRKDKGDRYEDELACWYFLTFTERIRECTELLL
jgi:hypothetical protein